VTLLTSGRTSRARVRLRSSAPATAGLTAAAGRLLTPQRLARARTAVGLGMLVRPSLLATGLGVDRVSAERTGWAVQMLGAREVALGAGASVALRRGDDRAARLWLAAGLVADAVDALAMAGALGRGRVRAVPGAALVGVAATAAAVQAAALADH
jgi:hypothetical protein